MHPKGLCFTTMTVVILATCAPSARAADWYTGAPSSQINEARASDAPRIGGSNSGWSAPSWSTPAPTTPVVTYPVNPAPGVARPSKFGAAIDVSATADTKDSQFITVIGTIAPFSGFDQSGIRFRAAGVFGRYAYIGSNIIGRVRGNQSDGSFMVGYEWVKERLSVAVYGGVNINDNHLDKYDPYNGAAGNAVGGKIAADFYYRPTATMMVAGVGSYSSAHSSYYLRLKAGFAIARELYVGPEIGAIGDNFFSQFRIGAHLTGARMGPFQFGASVGFLSDRVRGTGLYGAFDTRLTF